MEKIKQLSLSQLGLYNPQRLSDETVEDLFVVRKKYFQLLMDKINKEKANSIPQHHLFIGQRGMGKSTLLKRIEVELRKKDSKFIPLLFPEEQYNLSNLSEFWLNSLDAMADALELTKNEKEVKEIDSKVKELQKIKDEDDLAKGAYSFLIEMSKKINKRPVLLIDNMSFIFDRLNKNEQHTLRAWLMQNNAPILIGASAVDIEGTFDYGAPFYDAFQISYLKKLSFEELLEILNNLAKLTNANEVLNNIHEEIGRLKTIHHLTGGNPRTAVMLFKIIVKGFSKEINDDLEALLDEITPLYKARFEELPTQLQIIVDSIALHWDPINLEQLRNETKLENGQLSPQLKRLVELGWIEKLDAYKAKGSAYQISERFFNIWFLMRRSSRRQKKELYCLSKFLETFYGDDLHEVAKNSLSIKSKNINQIAYKLALAEVVKDEELKKLIKENCEKEIKEESVKNPKIYEKLGIEPQNQIEIYKKENNFLELEKIYLKKLENDDSDIDTWFELAYMYEVNMKKFNEAEKAYHKIISYDKEDSNMWYNLGNLYKYHLKDYSKAENAYQNALKIDKLDADTYNGLGNLYKDNLKEYSKSEEMFLKAIQIDNLKDYYWFNLGGLYHLHLSKFNEAEQAYLKAIELNKNNSNYYFNLGGLYHFKLENFDESKKAYLKAIELNNMKFLYWKNLGILYLNNFNSYKDAEIALNKALELNKNDSDCWYVLGHLYQFYLKNYEKSEEAYLAAIKLGEKPYYSWTGLGHLYKYNLKNYKKSENAYLTAIKLDKKNYHLLNSLGDLYLNYLDENKKAENCFLKAIKINKESSSAKFNLIFIYRDKIDNIKEAKKIFESIEIEDNIEDTYWLNKSLFDLYDKNEGIARDYFLNAIKKIDDKLPNQDDWWKFGAVVIKLGYGNWMLSILKENNFDTRLAPYYVAIKALTENNSEGYLDSKAVEIREPARKIMEIMKKY